MTSPFTRSSRLLTSLLATSALLAASCSGSSQQAHAPADSANAQPRSNDTAHESSDASNPAPTPISSVDAGSAEPAPPEDLSFRPFAPPAPQVIEAATTSRELKTGESCSHVDEDRYSYERIRELAALDAELRRKGGMLLPLRRAHSVGNKPQRAPGSIFRGLAGERLMVVGYATASTSSGVVGMSRELAVFPIQEIIKARKTRSIKTCKPSYLGCNGGTARAEAQYVVEVPEGARLAQARRVVVPMKMQVHFKSPRVPCPLWPSTSAPPQPDPT